MTLKANKILKVIRPKYTPSKILKGVVLFITFVNIINHLFSSNLKTRIASVSSDHVLNNLTFDETSTKEHDIQIHRKYCGSDKCKFLFAHYIAEQETQANSHFYSFIQLAEMLNRTVVLVNVQNSGLGSCKKLPFDFYYDVKQIKALFPNVNFITQRDFQSWTKQLYHKPDTVFRYIEQDGVPNTMKTVSLDLDVLLRDECLDQFDLNFREEDDSTFKIIFIGLRSYWSAMVSNLIVTEYLTTHMNLEEEVLLIRHELRYPLFPSKGPVVPLPYARHLLEAANDTKERLGTYMGIHWRMETARPEMMPTCAKGLVKYVERMMLVKKDIKNIYFATDYPLFNPQKSQSSTFQDLNDHHHEAMRLLRNSTFRLNTWVSMKSLNLLYEKFPEYEKEIDQEFKESGIQGIFDKLVLIGGDYFVSGPRDCVRYLSNFTKRISEARNKLIRDGNKTIRNKVSRWSLN